ncbi:hypothetical protein E1281_25970 [Actinomadura sp. KC345]|uniref:hypothetical protein n=1 Tax=Actinomadura sp. KC345 TaxID=2530371 RepID=UPI001053ABC2|nr:hypothetical protein [Actinomadura sp. KC345]TDC47651.1 hypothetical protein E1281_25970 [Actinomadura sp. KC345]
MDEPDERQATPTRGGDGKFTRSPETAERDAEAARLRGRGLSYRKIAAELEMDVSSAHAAVQRALRAIVEEPAEDARALELERLDTALAAVMRVLEADHVVIQHGKVVELNGQPVPDDAPVLQAVDRIVKISESRRKLLGLDAAQKLDVGGGITYEVVGVPQDDL